MSFDSNLTLIINIRHLYCFSFRLQSVLQIRAGQGRSKGA